MKKYFGFLNDNRKIILISFIFNMLVILISRLYSFLYYNEVNNWLIAVLLIFAITVFSFILKRYLNKKYHLN
ncbi:hypothetical protein AZF37_07230 [endosymbiont 'TC1' of Trimyema compressum]|nr:hypothetical protein AZF37_07230 [endosymbiont 'TC1' of Trimyema compressum]